MKRREFMKIGLGGLVAVTTGSMKMPETFTSGTAVAERSIELAIDAAMVEMIDGNLVFHWLFGMVDPFTKSATPTFPGPAIFVVSGEAIMLKVTNHLHEPHAFRIVGTDIAIPLIEPGETGTVSFNAPPAGTYLYIDPLNEPVNRVLGLHGAFVVTPATGNTPYNAPTPAVQQLFDDLGTASHFPKHAHSPVGWQAERFRIWVQHQIDPRFNAMALADFEAGRASGIYRCLARPLIIPPPCRSDLSCGHIAVRKPVIIYNAAIDSSFFISAP